eukprot:RCo051306
MSRNSTVWLSMGLVMGTLGLYFLAYINQIFKRPKNRRPALLQRITRPSRQMSPNRGVRCLYTNSQVGLSFEYPSSWRLEERLSADTGARTITLQPPLPGMDCKNGDGTDPNPDSVYRVQVAAELLLPEPSKGRKGGGRSLSLDQYTELTKRQVMEHLCQALRAEGQPEPAIAIEREARIRVAG